MTGISTLPAINVSTDVRTNDFGEERSQDGTARVEQFREYFRQARAHSDRLFAMLQPEALFRRPIAERHRVIFYIGHLDGFDSIQICREGLGIASPNPAYDRLFQAGIDPEPGQLPSDVEADWPKLEEILEYARVCRDHVDRYLAEAPSDTVQMALEHRQMHLETLAYMFHNFPYEAKVVPSALPVGESSAAPRNSWCFVPAGEAELGKPDDGKFGWDNEYPLTIERVEPFEIQKYSVSNGEYLEHIRKNGLSLPHFWVERDGELFYRGMLAEIPLPLDWPVYVTQHEAAAYAHSYGCSLPTEAQFHRAAYGSQNGEYRCYPWGNNTPEARHGNFDFRRWDPEPVTASPAGESAWGVRQLVGNGWQWTGTPFGPFPGFQARDSYPGYSSNFFDDKHFVIKGGSPQTAATLLRASFRNWFRADYPFVYATFRCVRN